VNLARALGLAASLMVGCAPTAPDGADAVDLRGPASFGGTFHPRHAPYGGFGGAAGCTAVRTPVILLHGNSESADAWLRLASDGGPSAPARLAAAGYRGCELFAVTWLPAASRSLKQLHVHDAAEADQIAGFIDDVLAYTGAARVDLIGHSMGVTVGLHALDRGQRWSRVRRFISIAGGLRGLANCLPWGSANPAAPACWAQSLIDPDLFGYYPLFNPRMEKGGFRDRPAQHPEVLFYSLRAGSSDEILCPSCDTALFDAAPNLRAQLDVGVGQPLEGNHDDTSGVGHLRARRDTGQIQAAMLTTECTGAACCASYAGACRE
jgi:pimeloyl-ACP methyl ester carboxylesterase